MSSSDYEISFLLEGLHQFRFHGSEEQADEIRLAMKKDSKASDIVVGDLQVYPVGGSGPAGGAESLLDILIDALSLDEDDQVEQNTRAVRALAQQVDTATDTGSKPQPYLVEFVWNNGGGDDNPFADEFLGDTQHAQINNQFAHALEQWLESNDHGYDFTWGIASEQHPLMSKEDAIQSTIDVFDECGIQPNFLSVLNQAQELETSTPTVKARKPRRTL